MLLKKESKLRNCVRRFHEDEGGMQSLETVVLLAIAAALGIGLYWLWGQAEVGGEEGGIVAAAGRMVGDLFEAAVESFFFDLFS